LSHGRDKYSSRINRALVNEILRREWDPIGVDGLPEDEYESYAAAVYVAIMDHGATAREVADYLFRIETEHMGLSFRDRTCADQIAVRLIALRDQLENG